MYPHHSMIDNVTLLDLVSPLFDSKLGYWLDIIIGLTVLVIGVIGIGLNFYFLYLLKSCTPTEPFDMLMANVALTDLILIFCTFPMLIVSSFSHRWVATELGCLIYAFISFFCGLQAITAACLLAFGRYLLICQRHLSSNYLKYNYARKGWIIGAAFNLLVCVSPFFGFGKFGPERHGIGCTLDWTSPKNKEYTVVTAVIYFLVPIFFISTSYLLISMEVQRAETSIKKCCNQHQRTALLKNMNKRSWSKLLKPSNIEKTRRAIKHTAIICTGFIICWGPYTIVALLESFAVSTEYHPLTTALPCLFAKTSVILNPLIFIFSRKELAAKMDEHVNHIFCCRLNNKNSPKVVTRFQTPNHTSHVELLSPEQNRTKSVSSL